MKAVLAIFELLTGLAAGAGALLMLASLAGISTPTWSFQFFLYWGAMFAGPLQLVIGALLTLMKTAERPAAVLILIGAATLTCWAIYLVSSVPAER